mgnify:CR=1 FL=1|tara:strand:+ start:444 stop:746 length:303 start_codon:yes stop_codon:yes gene_type:complete
MVQLKLPFDGEQDTGVYAYEVYTYKDRENKTGYEGHVRFVAASSIEEARHRAAFDFPRFWLWCGVKQVDIKHLEKQVGIFERQYERAKTVLQEIQESKRS